MTIETMVKREPEITPASGDCQTCMVRPSDDGATAALRNAADNRRPERSAHTA